MQNIQTNNQGGYVALITVLLIAAVLAVVIVGQGVRVWASQQVILLTWSRQQSLALADSCVRLAAARIRDRPIPFQNWHVQIGEYFCNVIQATADGGNWSVVAQATVHDVPAQLTAKVDGVSFAVTIESQPP